MTYALIAPPLAEPLTLAEVKAHLRLDGTEEDALLQTLVKVAREHLERVAELALVSQTWRLYRDRWPADGVIHIAKGPVQAIESVTVYDADGVAVDLSLQGHRLDGQARPARLILNQNMKSEAGLNGIEIDFVAGFGGSGAEVPDTLKRAMLLHVAQMHAFRGALSADSQPAVIPDGYARLIAPFELRRL